MKKLIVDPPSGWKYGFPCEYDPDKESLLDLLRAKGYPPDEIPFALQYSRYWTHEE